MQLIELLKEKSMKVTPIGYDTVKYVFDYNVFAELIIRECIKVVQENTASPNGYQALLKHFGVKE